MTNCSSFSMGLIIPSYKATLVTINLDVSFPLDCFSILINCLHVLFVL